MTPERYRQAGHLYHAAMEREPDERAAFLDSACDGDEELRSEVESLLAAHDKVGNYFAAPAMEVAAGFVAQQQNPSLMGRSLSHYRVLSLIGAGGMGEVYLAEDTHLGRKVALKLLPSAFTQDQERVRRFEQEARAASVLNHPNIVTIHEIGKLDGAHFIVTEYIEGHTLRQQMAGARMKLREAIDVATQVANALEAAHKAGIVHRDIKPENIMLRPDGLVKVLDFGLAKLTEPQMLATDTDASTVVRVKTESGLVLGTISYMSPEQARGQGVDARTDLFSLGVALYEMVAGRRPFEGATMSDVIAAILREEPVSLRQHSREAPAELDWIVQKALAKDREERYQTIKELQIDLKRLKQELERQAKLEGVAPSRSQDAATRSAGRTTDDSTLQRTTLISEAELAPAGSDSRSAVSESKQHRRIVVPRLRTLLVAFAAIAIFSIASFYAGLKQAPPSQPNFRQLTFRRGTISTARFAPDGKTIVYSAAFDGKPTELFTRRLESPESSPLKLQAGIQSIFAGEMLILLDCELDWGECHNGTLARMPLVGGTPREIMENVFEADWSADGKEMAIVRVVEGKFQLEYPMGTFLYKSAGRINAIRVSPKGDMVAFIDHPVLGSNVGSVVVMDRAGQAKTLAGGLNLAWGLAWSPTGDEVWFSASENKGQSLYAVTLSGQQRLVFKSPTNLRLYDISHDGRVLAAYGKPRTRMISFTADSEKERDVSWFDWSTSADISADGKNLLFYEWGRAVEEIPFVYLRKLDGSNDAVRLGQGKALALSPDAKWAIALQEGPPPQLVLLPTGPGEPRLLPRGEIVEYSYASWFPDGQRILFTGIEQEHGLRSYVQDVSTGQMRPIIEEGTIALMVSPEGKRLYGWTPDGGSDGRYYLSSIDGTAPTAISGLRPGDEPIQWSADGRAIYVRGPSDFDPNIYRIDLSSGGRKLWKEIAPDPVGLIGIEERPGGVKITPDGKSYVYTYWVANRDLFEIEGLK